VPPLIVRLEDGLDLLDAKARGVRDRENALAGSGEAPAGGGLLGLHLAQRPQSKRHD
jgi:hypothetical protein